MLLYSSSLEHSWDDEQLSLVLEANNSIFNFNFIIAYSKVPHVSQAKAAQENLFWETCFPKILGLDMPLLRKRRYQPLGGHFWICLLKLQYEVCLFSSPPAPPSCLSLFYKYCAYNIILQLLKLKARAESFNRLYLDLVFSPVRNLVVDLTNVIILWGRISSWRYVLDWFVWRSASQPSLNSSAG